MTIITLSNFEVLIFKYNGDVFGEKLFQELVTVSEEVRFGHERNVGSLDTGNGQVQFEEKALQFLTFRAFVVKASRRKTITALSRPEVLLIM
jgi:hypothetical protein